MWTAEHRRRSRDELLEAAELVTTADERGLRDAVARGRRPVDDNLTGGSSLELSTCVFDHGADDGRQLITHSDNRWPRRHERP